MNTLKNKGQIPDVGAIVSLLIVIGVGALVLFNVTGALSENMPDHETFSAEDTNFAAVDAWSLENTSPLAISHNSSDEWIDMTATSSGTGTARVVQTVHIGVYDTIDNATLDTAYHIENGDNLNNENIYLRLYDPAGNVDYEEAIASDKSSTVAWTTASKDVASSIDEAGDWEIEVYVEAEVAGTGFETNIDNTSLTVNTTTNSAGIIQEIESMSGTIFNLLLVLGLVIVAVVIISVVRGRMGGNGPTV